MDRERLEELVSGHLDGELSSAEDTELKALLESSEEARGLLESYRGQGEKLRSLPELKAPEKLRSRVVNSTSETSRVVRRPSTLWFWGSIAACFLFFYGGHLLSPKMSRFYLSTSGLSAQAKHDTSTYQFSSGAEPLLSLESPALQGTIGVGDGYLAFRADAGALAGKRLKARLSVDTDGDGTYELTQESDTFALDSKPGFQDIRTSFDLNEVEGQKLQNGRAKLELICEDTEVNGIRLQFTADDAHLSLPLGLPS